MLTYFIVAVIVYAVSLAVIWGLHGAFPKDLNAEDARWLSFFAMIFSAAWIILLCIIIVAVPVALPAYGSYWFFNRRRRKKDAKI